MFATEDYIWTFVVCGTYHVTHLIGRGAGGSVARAFNMITGREVAIKIEPLHVNAHTDHPSSLAYEAAVYDILAPLPEGFPKLHWSGENGDQYVIIMEKLGPNLGSLRKFCRGSFTLRTICMLVEQMLTRLEYVHSCGLVVGDVKPHNFAVGSRGNRSQIVHLFDFGHAKLYIDPSTGSHVPLREHCTAIGTPTYASVSAHFGRELCRRDDIESLFYVLLEFHHGKLPWDSIFAPSPQAKVERTKEMKAGDGLRDFVATQTLPEFQAFYEYCTRLSFSQKPDYDFLRGLFRERMRKEGWENDCKFDWVDPSSLERGTLIPDEYVVDMRFVTKPGVDPQ